MLACLFVWEKPGRSHRRKKVEFKGQGNFVTVKWPRIQKGIGIDRIVSKLKLKNTRGRFNITIHKVTPRTFQTIFPSPMKGHGTNFLGFGCDKPLAGGTPV